ncbi:TIGR01244 family sulfur transferase [Tropicimonas sp. IMCC6043]|uniref:TIGR01244 family sulfur transferase n=1 Tax=Tropicimonas sp. IMCC6043 TaxID=2510645 RepID=UPI00101B6A58|nr:TIGR01244 family sulfur transferase [Tropicimonas sp. IMCC6043]RYH12002.1 TIGR01244 family phosphatase [Tropicimonas sp. IMCC6043]
MDIRALSDVYAVSPQILPEDVPAIAAAGFRTIICNRPDEEVVPGMRAADIRRAAEEAGLNFVELPLTQGDQFMRDLALQETAVATSAAPVLAYCASGTRSAVIWMCLSARTVPVSDLLDAANRAGYPLAALRPQLEAIARS